MTYGREVQVPLSIQKQRRPCAPGAWDNAPNRIADQILDQHPVVLNGHDNADRPKVDGHFHSARRRSSEKSGCGKCGDRSQPAEPTSRFFAFRYVKCDRAKHAYVLSAIRAKRPAPASSLFGNSPNDHRRELRGSEIGPRLERIGPSARCVA
uniref:Uncharacterized protein n=1 Tax=Trichuris muris TaxID=70415 RepID=A0A5S6QPB4_TRIMR